MTRKPKLPAIMIYTGDWKQDTALGKSSAATRGVWWEVILAMHEDGRTGRLSGTLEQLARICRVTTDEMTRAKLEIYSLKIGDVTDRDGIVTLTNRRMLREHKERSRAKLAMKRIRSYENVTDVVSEKLPPSSTSLSTSLSFTLSKEEESLRGKSSCGKAGNGDGEFSSRLQFCLGDALSRDGEKWMQRHGNFKTRETAESVINEMRANLIEGRVIKKRGGYAEDLWKRMK